MDKNKFFDLLNKISPNNRFKLEYIPVATPFNEQEYIVRLSTKTGNFDVQTGKVEKMSHSEMKELIIPKYENWIEEWRNT